MRGSGSRTSLFASVAVIVLVLLALGAAGVWRLYHTNPPFQVLLTDEQVAPQTNFHPTPAPATWSAVSVLTASGSSVRLTDSLLPALVVAYWCPHCQRTLVLFMRHHLSSAQKPTVISTGFAYGTTLLQARQITAQEERALGIKGLHIDYWLADWQAVVKQFPTLLFRRDKQWQVLEGEHTWDAWRQALP